MKGEWRGRNGMRVEVRMEGMNRGARGGMRGGEV